MTNVSEILSLRERSVYKYVASTTKTTSKEVSNALGYPLNTANRILNKLVDKNYLLRSPYQTKKGYTYFVPTPSGEIPTHQVYIPFKDSRYSLDEILLYLEQNMTPEPNDFQKMGLVIHSAINHLLYRVLEKKQGIPFPTGPSPVEIHQFISAAIQPYRDFVDVLETIRDLPIYNDDPQILRYYAEINDKLVNELEIKGFQPWWNKGIASIYGVKDKFRATLEIMRMKRFNEYGAGQRIHNS